MTKNGAGVWRPKPTKNSRGLTKGLRVKPENWIVPSTKMKGRTPLSTSMLAATKIRPAAIEVGIRLERGQGFGFHNFRHSLATFIVNKGM